MTRAMSQMKQRVHRRVSEILKDCPLMPKLSRFSVPITFITTSDGDYPAWNWILTIMQYDKGAQVHAPRATGESYLRRIRCSRHGYDADYSHTFVNQSCGEPRDNRVPAASAHQDYRSLTCHCWESQPLRLASNNHVAALDNKLHDTREQTLADSNTHWAWASSMASAS